MMKLDRTWAWAGVGILAIAGLAWLSSPRAILVETAPVVSGRFEAFVEEDGRTRVRDLYVVTAPLSGRVPRSIRRVGDKVTVDEPLTTMMPSASPLIDPRARRELEERVGTAEAALEEAKALQERAQVQLTRTRSDLDRSTQLTSRGVTAAAQLERDTFAFQSAERDQAAAERRRHAAEHALEQARAAVRKSSEPEAAERFVVLSPANGRILKVVQESEGSVAAGAPLFEIGDTADLEVIVDVLTSDAAGVREGARVLLERSGTQGKLEGYVRRIEPSGFAKISALGVEEQRVWIVIDLKSPRSEWATLGAGYRVGVKIVLQEIEAATIIPTGAVFRAGDAWSVFVIERGKAALRKVNLLRRDGRQAAIEQGLKPGERVVVYPPTTLKAGASVRAL